MSEWKRKRPRREKPYKKKKFSVWYPSTSADIVCPRCGRDIEDSSLGRRAHKQSCVHIPENRPKEWGKKVRNAN